MKSRITIHSYANYANNVEYIYIYAYKNTPLNGHNREIIQNAVLDDVQDEYNFFKIDE